jgi:polyphosphate glucokinase
MVNLTGSDGPRWPHDVRTLAIDIGGSGLKATVLDSNGTMLAERVRIDTPYPCPPQRLVGLLGDLVAPLRELGAHRASAGFPGLVRHGRVIEVPSLSRREYGGETDPDLAAMWSLFDLQGELADRLAMPTLVANDADIQGCAVVEGNGMEFVMTLGTGVGTGLFHDGELLPHMELSHGPFEEGMTFDIALGNAQRKEIGNKKWAERVRRSVDAFHEMLWFDRLYIGGGNAKHLEPKHLGSGDLSEKAEIVSNTAGLLGGVRIWDLSPR